MARGNPKPRKYISHLRTIVLLVIEFVVDGSFDASYMLTIRVGETNTILEGIISELGLSVPISEANDIAPNVKLIKRDESIIFPEAPNTSNSMSVGK